MSKTRLAALRGPAAGDRRSVLAACGGGGSSSSSSEATKRAAAKKQGSPSASAPTSPIPRSSRAKRASYTGFDVELMEAIGKEIGREPEFIDSSFETIFRDVGQGKFEAVMSAATITEEREKEVAFSTPYYLSEQAILVKEGSEIKGLADLKGKIVGAQQGTTGLELGKEKAEAGELRPYPEGPDAINALKAGTVEAVIIDAPVARTRPKNSAASKSSKKSRPKKRTGSPWPRTTPNCSNRSTKA